MTGFPTVGGEFGGYRIEHVIGRGGMGVVFAATQLRLNRRVALKVLPPEFAQDPGYRSRFLHECGALIRLDSPHVVTVYDAGEIEGNLYLAMQLVSGPDLGDLLRSGPLPAVRALAIAAQVAQALDDSHHVGVLHRDIKPSNVLLRTGRSGDDFVYLCDFGLARSTEDQTRTVMGVMGTPGYLPPERLEGGDATVATDLYALGCLLWALITGAPPYAGSQWQIINGHLSGPVPQLVVSDARSRALNDIFLGSLAKSPQARYRSAADMRSALLGALALPGDPPPALLPPTAQWPQAPGQPPQVPVAAPTQFAGPAPYGAHPPPGRSTSGTRVAVAVAAVAAVAAMVIVMVAVLVNRSGSGPDGATGPIPSTPGISDSGESSEPEPDPRTAPAAQRALAAALPTNATNCVAIPDDDSTRTGWASAEYLCDGGAGMSQLIAAKVDSSARMDSYVSDWVAQDLASGTCPGDAPAQTEWSLSGEPVGTLYCLETADGANVQYVWTNSQLGVVFVVEGRTASRAAVNAFWTALRYP